MMAFLVMAALWWAVFLKREELVGVLSVAREGEGGSGTLGRLAGVYAASRVGRAILGPLGARRRPRPRRRQVEMASSPAASPGAARIASPRPASSRARSSIGRQRARLDSRYEASKRLLAEQGARRDELAALERERSKAIASARGA